MSMTDTVRWMGRSARSRAEAVGHQMKDRALEKRLERASEEAERLRLENEMLREEVSESRSEHHRVLDLLESRLSDPDTAEKKSHKGRWLLFLMALGGGAYAWMRMRSEGNGAGEWSGSMSDSPTVTRTSSSTP